jgi:8-oxo-dGTP pyrophosphatase MutT (NUDIX family)
MSRLMVRSAVFAILWRGNRLLLAQRINTGHEDGNFGLPAGHIDEGETALDALVREAHEETGIALDRAKVRLVHMQHYTRKERGERTSYIDWYFECRDWAGEPQVLEPDKCGDLRWVTLEALPANTISYIRDMLTQTYVHGRNYSEWGWREP